MIVISKKDNRRLIAGQSYETDFFDNQAVKSQNGYGHGRISIKGIGYYGVENFTKADGSELPQILYDTRAKFEIIKAEDLKKGDIIVCTRDNNYKYLIKDGKYRIEDVSIVEKKNRYSNIPITEGLIKLEGYNRWIKWNHWSFRKLTTQESREISLSQILDKEENFSVEYKSKYEQSQNKEKILIETIASSILDPHRHHLSVIDWGVHKVKKNYNITKEDFDSLLDMKFSDILSKVENFKKN